MWRRLWGAQPWEMASKPHESSRTLPPVHSRPAGGDFAVENTDLRFSVLCVGLDHCFLCRWGWLVFFFSRMMAKLLFISLSQGRGKSFLSWPCRMNYTEMIANEELCPFTKKWSSLLPMGEDSTIRGRPKVMPPGCLFSNFSYFHFQEGNYFLRTTGEEPFSYSSFWKKI